MEILNYLLLLFNMFVTVCQAKQIYKANEESGKDAYLGNIPQDYSLPPITPGETNREYQILNGANIVRVEKDTGSLYTATRLDREAICPDNPPKCIKDIEVVVLPPKYFQLIKVQVEVEDLNDNTPEFPSSDIPKEISESAVIGSVIRLDSAVDKDFGKNSIQRYEITSSPPSPKDKRRKKVPFFNLEVLENIDGTKIPQLILSKGLDREKISAYELLLYAIDGGTPALTGTATVRITVTDSNDHQPIFEKDSYVIPVLEDVDVGYEIVQLQATDQDSGPNARIVYSFPSVVSDQDRQIFELNQDTGLLTVKGRGLDYENKTIHHLTVKASDSGPNPASVYASVTVQVQDVNDENPDITVNFMDFIESNSGDSTGTENNPVLVKENTAVGTYLAFVTITDRDTGMNGNVSCRLQEPTSFEMIKLDRNENRYLIKTKNELDRETQRLHYIEIEAWDFGTPSLSSQKRIVVELSDENDNDPTFGKPNYNLDVSENVSPGKEIAKLKAQDLDAGVNAEITYSSRPTLKDTVIPFRIDSQSGSVIFEADATPLDAENMTVPFLLTITATDHGVPPRNTSTTLKISITDENDNAPTFSQSIYIFRVKEDTSVGTNIGSVSAVDADLEKDTNARITYSFQKSSNEDSDHPPPFTITPDHGEIYFNGPQSALDREERLSQPYTLQVEARDNGNEPLMGKCVVEIYLIDVNDNKPSIKYPNVTRDVSFLYILDQSAKKPLALKAPQAIKEKAANIGTENETEFREPVSAASDVVLIGKSGSSEVWAPDSNPIVITKILAIDPDDGENGRVRFAMSKGNKYGYFGVDMVTGNVTLKVNKEKELRSMKRGCHIIEVTVSDMGKPFAKSTPTWVSIYITHASPGSVNVTEALNDCRNDSFFPLIYKQDAAILATAGFSQLILIIIISVGSVLLILVIVGISMLIKYRCQCCGDKKARTYNVPSASDMYGDGPYGSPDVRHGKKGSPRSHRIPDGTVDSRSSFYSEWTASQMQLAQEKGQIEIPREPSEESLRSQNSARDSGTGDSMPSDAYHTTAGGMYRHHYPNQLYGRRQAQPYNPSHLQPSHVYLPPQDDINVTTDDESRQMIRHPHGNGMVFTPKCTNDCRLYGHGDNCWMPDSLQRPPSRMTSFQSPDEYDSDSLKYPKRAMTPSSYHRQQQQVDGPDFHNMRYTNAPTSTPFYYDPGSKFDPSAQQRGKFSTFRDDNMGSDNGSPAHSQVASSNVSRQLSATTGYRGGGYPTHGQIAQPAYSQSPVPFNNSSSAPYNPNSRGKAYIHLQGGGYDVNGPVPEEVHSNLSSASSGNQHPAHPQSFPQQLYHQDQSYPVHYPSSYQGYGGPQPLHGRYSDQQQYGGEPEYEQDFAATNLLLSPVDSEPDDYKQRLELQMMQQQQQMQQPGYNYGHHSESDGQRLLDNRSGPDQGDDETSLDKLSTIREELDADEVVAEIDGLLL